MNTKFIPRVLLAAAALLMSAQNASAYSYTPDTLLFSDLLGNSGDGLETQTLADYLNIATAGLTLDAKVDSVNFVAALDAPDHWYVDISPLTPGYFLLKFGIGGTGATADTFYFQNVAELTKLVWTNEQVQNLTGGNCGANSTGACNIGRLSHYSLFDAQSSGGGGGQGSVPEPDTVALLGIGILGMGLRGFGKRRQA
ncbi:MULTISPECIES: PEP-CTERM sorting domain-containing protein [Methylomonas]|uniref:Ice-binding protein C-terminal domain-containing protein n=2 Tax=Methylomonas TaxID=416 RepID=A0A126T770_9GAMM|nr:MULTISPECIES: PEP-CTERM sorting domain-containing protein [Methylomonas]AMK77921.1 hypothetical protein JT25_015790 [Methylomonas denitrificans]OAI08848.1 hypothetical protein A1342_09550 [Methylomonas methanica]TCV85454.1 putative secreted protein with PEP-CTERM sorting signal [Methylomonas methanica]